ncbi:hypothetical protein FNF29_01069 [Cafeteria roenbergensis]|nr:hypothetical protein FNF29_01069 [Cafeteria roenbergensis]KAA0165635.1 hypothetical protein FNF28_03385 [Cafeteria roenbergensis]|eukprot:KAA0156276.1 hypothetical protein FNF29_01069 [Cafeteria roenbergensis]
MVRMTARSEARGRRRAWLGQLLAAVGVALLALDAATWMTGVAALGGVRLWAAAAAVCGALLWKSASQAVVAETVLVLGDVGVQLITSFRGGGSTKRLVDASRVRAAIINEHVALSGVHNYVGLVVDGLDHMEVLFPSFKLPIPLVEHSCWVVSHVVFGEPEPPVMNQKRFDERRRATTWGPVEGRGSGRHEPLAPDAPAA